MRSRNTNLHFDGSFNGGPGFFAGDETDHPVTPKAGLTWQPTHNSTYYCPSRRATGSAASILNQQYPTCLPDRTGRGRSAGKALADLQSGFPVELRGGREGGLCWTTGSICRRARFHIRWNNIQQSAQISNCGFAAVFNLGTADSNGFDLSLRAAATDNLRLGLQVAYTDAHYNTSEGGIVSAGDVIGGPGISTGAAVPPWTVTANAEYTFHIADKSAYIWLEDVYHSANRAPSAPRRKPISSCTTPGLLPDPSTNVINLRTDCVSIRSMSRLFANNLTDTHPQLSFLHTNPGDPRFQAVDPAPAHRRHHRDSPLLSCFQGSSNLNVTGSGGNSCRRNSGPNRFLC